MKLKSYFTLIGPNRDRQDYAMIKVLRIASLKTFDPNFKRILLFGNFQ